MPWILAYRLQGHLVVGLMPVTVPIATGPASLPTPAPAAGETMDVGAASGPGRPFRGGRLQEAVQRMLGGRLLDAVLRMLLAVGCLTRRAHGGGEVRLVLRWSRPMWTQGRATRR